MCKVACIAGVKKSNLKNAWKLAIEMTPEMTKNDQDGFGYSASGPGGLFGERWLNVSKAWKQRESMTQEERALLDRFGGALKGSESYNAFGRLESGSANTISLHARMATCGVGLENTHPFVSPDGKTSLIHNGVVSTFGMDLKTSTCDSEGILNAYLDAKVSANPKAIRKVAKRLDGYYACVVLGTDKTGRRYVDIFKCDRAELGAVLVNRVGLVFCTKPSMIKKAARRCGFKHGAVFTYSDCMLVRLDAVTGEVICRVGFKKRAEKYSKGYDFSREYKLDRSLPVEGSEAVLGSYDSDSELNSDDAPKELVEAFNDPFHYESEYRYRR